MSIKEFLQKTIGADPSSRTIAIKVLCEAYVSGQLSDEDMRIAENSMVLFLEDNAPQVRRAMASVLAHSDYAPPMIINALAQDQIDISASVLAYSPVLSDNSLVDLIATGDIARQFIIARRDFLNASVCAALIEVGDQEAVLTLLENTGAQIAQLSIIKLANRFGHYGPIRNKLLERFDLPVNIRQELVEKLGETFANNAFICAFIGKNRAQHITKDACLHATLSLAETIESDDMIVLVEYLCIAGKMTPIFLMHILCTGHVDFFAAAISRLSGKPASRIKAILSDGQYSVMKALYMSAGLEIELCPVFIRATLLWRNMSKNNSDVAINEVIEILMNEYADKMYQDSPIAELLMMLESIQFNQSRKAAKQYALVLTQNAA